MGLSRVETNYIPSKVLVNGGFDTPANLEDLTYSKFMSCSPHVGSIDIMHIVMLQKEFFENFLHTLLVMKLQIQIHQNSKLKNQL